MKKFRNVLLLTVSLVAVKSWGIIFGESIETNRQMGRYVMDDSSDAERRVANAAMINARLDSISTSNAAILRKVKEELSRQPLVDNWRCSAFNNKIRFEAAAIQKRVKELVGVASNLDDKILMVETSKDRRDLVKAWVDFALRSDLTLFTNSLAPNDCRQEHPGNQVLRSLNSDEVARTLRVLDSSIFKMQVL